MLRDALKEACLFCDEKGVSLTAIESVQVGTFERVERISKAVNTLISPDPLRKEFLAHERLVRTLFQAVKPDPAVLEFVSRVSCLAVIADEIRLRTGGGGPADISVIM